MSPLDQERFLRSGGAPGWVGASQDTVDWLLAEKERLVTVRSPGRVMRVDRSELQSYLDDGWTT
jgi:hypothetical protein